MILCAIRLLLQYNVPETAILTINHRCKINTRLHTLKHNRYTDFQGKTISQIQLLCDTNPENYFERYTLTEISKAMKETLGYKSMYWTLQLHSNRPTKQKARPNRLIWKAPPACPQLAKRPSSNRQVSEQKRQHDNEISGDTFAVGKKRSRDESMNVEQDIPYKKKARQRFPATQPNHPPHERLATQTHTEKDHALKKTTIHHTSVASSFAMYHQGVPDHAICTVTDTKGLQLLHRTFLTTRIHGRTLAECKRAYEMHYRELSGNCKTYQKYNGGNWHQYHCFQHRVNHKQCLRGRAPRLSFTKI